MINVKELRIGNFISDDDGVLAKVNGFEPFDHSTRCDEEEGCQILVDCYHANGARRTGCITDSPECNPIPLTPEWLGKFGFDDIGPYWQYNGEPNFVLLKEDGVAFIGNPVRTYVKTVHHLQNLYFALTEGIELQIKMP